MTSLTVQCPDCSLKLADVDHPDVAYERDPDGQILCPNCKLPMKPIGASAVMSAEDAFRQANEQLAADVSVLPAETTETLTKRLREIELAHHQVIDAQQRYKTKHDAAKEAKKYLDDKVETFLTLAGRLSAVPGVLPLFSQEAHDAAAATTEDRRIEPDQTRAEGLYERLVEAGYLAASVEIIAAWSEEQQNEAGSWAAVGTEDELPAFMRELATQNEAEHQATQTASATA